MNVAIKTLFLCLLLVCCVENFVCSAQIFDLVDENSVESRFDKKRKIESTLYTSKGVAHYFLALDFERRAKKNEGVDITPLKLQKLLYYAQGYHLALFETPFFDENFLKWEKGPVAVSVYHDFSYRNLGITRSQSIMPKHCTDGGTQLKQFVVEGCQTIRDNDRFFLKLIYDMCLYKTGELLSEETHNQRPWQETHGQGNIIEKKLMNEYFKGPAIFNFINTTQDVSFEDAANSINNMRKFLIFYSKKQLEEYQSCLENLGGKIVPTLIERVNASSLVFDDQTPSQAFLGNFFFPDLLESGFDHSLTYFQHRTIPTLLAFSAYYKNPIALFYLSNMFREFDYENAANHFFDDAKTIFTKTLETQKSLPIATQNRDLIGVCSFYISEMLIKEGDYNGSGQAMAQAVSLLSRSENSKLLLQIAKRITDVKLKRDTLLKAQSMHEMDAIPLLANLEESQEQKRQKLKEASSKGSAQVFYTLGGLILQEKPNSEEGIEYLKEAIKMGSYGAALHLAKKIPSQAETAYDLAAQFGFQMANYEKYKVLIARGETERAKESLLDAGVMLHDEDLLEMLSTVEKERIDDDLETYWENLSRIGGFDLTPRESMASDSREDDELSHLILEDDL